MKRNSAKFSDNPMMEIPTREQWEEAWKGFDEAYAFDHFHGKPESEAIALLQESSERYCDDFLWMPEIPLRFYLKSFKQYLTSPESKEDYYAASSFIGLVDSILEHNPEWILETWESIHYVLHRLANQQKFYDDFTRPGKYRNKVDRILVKYETHVQAKREANQSIQ